MVRLIRQFIRAFRRHGRLTIGLAGGLAFLGPAADAGFGQVAAKSALLPGEAADVTDIEAFDEAWTIVRDSHWDTELGGIDWEAVKTELRPKAVTAETRAQIRELIEQMINRLGQSHFGLIPAEAYSLVAEDSRSNQPVDAGDAEEKDGGKSLAATAEAGLHARLRDRQLMVVRVDAGSSAGELGVRPGWTIERIGKRSLAEILEAAETVARRGPIRLETTVGLVARRRTRGKAGAELAIDFRDLGGNARAMKLGLRKTDAREVRFGNLPPMAVSFKQSRLPDDIVYFAFTVFLDPPRVLPAFRKAVDDARSAQGLVIDLRGNPGGLGGMTFAMASEFARRPGALGIMETRGARLRFPVFRQPNPFTGPVAVLIDECSISSAEILAGGLKDLGLARIFGNRSAGLALPSKIVRLANGDALQCAIARYTSASGKTLEGVGVEPDVEVIETREAFESSSDPVLDKATEWILNESGKGN